MLQKLIHSIFFFLSSKFSNFYGYYYYFYNYFWTNLLWYYGNISCSVWFSVFLGQPQNTSIGLSLGVDTLLIPLENSNTHLTKQHASLITAYINWTRELSCTLRSVEFPTRSLCTFHPHHDRYRTPFDRSRRIRIQTPSPSLAPAASGGEGPTPPFFERLQWSLPFSVRSLELLVPSLATCGAGTLRLNSSTRQCSLALGGLLWRLHRCRSFWRSLSERFLVVWRVRAEVFS